MRPWTQILVTVVIVAAGIFSYDALRDRPDPAPVTVPPARGASEPAETPTEGDQRSDPPHLGAVLEGTGDDLWRSAVDGRLAELEARLVSASPDADGSPASGAAGGPVATAPDDPGGEGPTGTADSEERTRQQLERFRTLLEAVERQRRREKAAWQVKQFLDRLDLALTEDQQKSAIRVTLDYQGRWARAKRTPAKTEEAKEARRQAFQTLWTGYGRALEEVIPRSEADKILDGLQNAQSKDGDRN